MAVTRGLPTVLFAALFLSAPFPARAQGAAHGAESLKARAAELEAQGNHAAALSLLWEASGLAPRDAAVLVRLGTALERIGALDGAIDAYRRALETDPAHRIAARGLILVLVKAGKGPEAVERARAMVADTPGDPEAHFTLGLAQSEQNVQQAMASFRQVLSMAPRHTLARYNLALVLKRTDRLSEAIDELKRTLQIEPRPEAHFTLGVIYWHQGELDRAARALREAVALDPHSADAQYTLGAVLKARREFPEAVDSLRRAIALRPDLWGARHTLAQVYQLSGNDEAARAEQAAAETQRARAGREQEAGVLTAVGSGRLDAGDPAGALHLFARATAAYEPYAPAHYQKGRALRALGRAEEARRAFDRARALNPGLVPPGTP